jgi:diaminopimelate epimerase
MKFVKMQGTGNDFLFIEAEPDSHDWEALSRAICDRHYGVGADGLILVLPSARADVAMRLFNVDGSEAEVSGNGVRCLVKYAVECGLAAAASGRVVVEAASGLLEAEVLREGERVTAVRLAMGEPRFLPAEIPLLADMEPPVLDLPLEIEGQRLRVSCLSMGNPHAVLFFAQPIARYPLERVGPAVEHHPSFPQRVNFGVARVLGRDRMELRVWERGVGETLACGSGSCAAMVAARLHNLVEGRVDISQPGGTLTVDWDGRGEVYLTGPAEFVFAGEWPG